MVSTGVGQQLTAQIGFNEEARQYECNKIEISRCDKFEIPRGDKGDTFEFLGGDRKPITAETVRELSIDRAMWTMARHALVVPRPDHPAGLRDLPNPDEREPWGRRMPEGLAAEGRTDRVLRWVAHFYRLSFALHEPPTAAVQELMGVSRATAGRWVKAARGRGYLGKAIYRKAGERF